MRIVKILRQRRRDFEAIYRCDHCYHQHTSYGYDDSNFHKNIIPQMKCPECGLTAGDDYRPLAPKNPDGVQL